MKNSHLNDGLRLQKYLALCGISSRRKSESFINEGRVSVNGITVLSRSYRIDDKDLVEIDGKTIKVRKKIYIVLNKPENIICSHNDQYGRKTIYDLINIKDEKLFSLGRLDYNSCGLIILTNDGDFANNVIHPSTSVIKQYYVESFNIIPEDLIRKFIKGITIKGVFYKAEAVKKNGNRSLTIDLKEGKKREIREVLKFYKVNIKLLKRTAIGKLNLDKLNIKAGEFKTFSYHEIVKLIY